jgi:thiol-disulfide isomerase/thioredoxin
MLTIIIIFIVLIYFFGDKIQKYLQKSSKEIISSNSKKEKEHYNSIDTGITVTQQNNNPVQNKFTIILCYADWCSHCPTVKSWYNDLVNQSPLSKCVFYAIEEKDLPNELLNKIPGFPTILIQKDNSIDVYNGPRSKDSLLSHLEKL